MCGIIALRYNNEIKESKNNEQNQALRKKVTTIFQNQISRGIRGAGMSVKTKEKNKVVYYRARDESATHFFYNSEQKFATLKEGDLVLLHHRYPTTNDNGAETTHPFMNEEKTISLIHNGTINNYETLKTELEQKGHTFETDLGKGITDSEVIIHLFEEGLQGKTHEKAIIEALEYLHERLTGGYAVAITMKGSDKIWLTRNNNPIEVYSDRYATYASSEKPEGEGFVTEKTLADGEIGYIHKGGYETIKIITKTSNKHNYNLDRNNWGYGQGISDDDTETEGFGKYGEELNENIDEELKKEREKLRCYTDFENIIKDMMEDITTDIYKSKEQVKKKNRGNYLAKHLWETLQHYTKKLKEESQKTEEMWVSYEEHIDELEERIREQQQEIRNLEMDYAEWKANFFTGNEWESYDEEIRGYNATYY